MLRPPSRLVLVALTALAVAAAAAAAGSPRPSVSFEFTPLGRRILVGADANAVGLPDGRVRVYWAAGSGQASATTSDGVRFTREPGIRLDPSLGPHTRTLQLPDGRWRLFFLDPARRGIGSAISDDGLAFAIEPGLRVSAEAAGVAPKLLSPGDVIKLRDGRWRMYFSTMQIAHRDPRTAREVIKSAVSTDLLDWRVEPGVRIGAGSRGLTGSGEHPAAVLLGDGSVALFYGRPSPFHLYVSVSRDGLSFTSEQPLVDEALDSAVVARRDGTFLLYYGSYDAATDTSYLNVGRLDFRRKPPPPTCTVPHVRGKELAVARAMILKANCGVGPVRRVRSTHLSEGWVVDQRPDSGRWLPRGARVTLVVSRGPGSR